MVLRERWNFAVEREGVAGNAADVVFAKLTKAYCEVWRHYHTLSHLTRMFEVLEERGGTISDSAEVIFAVFFHDLVYRPRSTNNEEMSAALAKRYLLEMGVKVETAEAAGRLILLTKDHRPEAASEKERAFLDADLAILAAPWDEYLEYARQIRREYFFVPVDRYVEGRSAVLNTFLERGFLFGTDPRATLLNERAAENMRRELEYLKRSSEIISGGEKEELAYGWPAKTMAVTGTIGSGKSSVIREFEAQGAFTVSADDLVEELYAPGSPTVAALGRLLGEKAILPDGKVDRGFVGREIFADAEKKALLEQLVHPRVHALASRRFAEAIAEGKKLLVYEVPLLFESGLDALPFKQIVVVTAPEEICIERVVERGKGKITAEAARARLRAQIPAAEKAARADVVIDNSGSLDDLRSQVAKLSA